MPLLINDQRIDDAAIDGQFSQIKSFHERMNNVSCCERDSEFRQTAKEQIIARVLLAQEARRAIAPSPADEIENALENLKKEHGGEAHFYASLGIAPDQLDLVRADLDIGLRVQKLMDQLVVDEAPPTDEELLAYYQANLPTFTRPEERRAAHISKAASPMADRSEAVKLFQQLREDLMNGADFDALAREHSDRGKDLVDLGYFRRGELPEDVEIVAFSMRAGETSPVFSSQIGIHIVKLIDIRPAEPMPFETVRPEALRLLMEDRKQLRAQELVIRLQKTARIQEIPLDPSEEDDTFGGD